MAVEQIIPSEKFKHGGTIFLEIVFGDDESFWWGREELSEIFGIFYDQSSIFDSCEVFKNICFFTEEIGQVT